MEIIDGLICYHILYQSTTRESIEHRYATHQRNSCAIANKLLMTVYSIIKDRCTRAVQSGGDSVRVSKYTT